MRILRAALGLVGMLLLAATCQEPPRARETPDLLPPGRPERVDASTFGTRWPIKHVVFIIKENRTTDHMFGRFPGVNGVIEGLDGDRRRPLTPALDRLPEDIPHCYECAIESWNEGRMNNFAQNPASRSTARLGSSYDRKRSERQRHTMAIIALARLSAVM